MRQYLRSLGAGLAMAVASLAPALGQDGSGSRVELRATAGDARIVGDLTGFEDGVYTLQTGFGVLRIPADTVSCTGAACPRSGPPAIALSVAPDLAPAMQAILSDFAASIGAEIATTGTADTVALRRAGDTLAEIALRRPGDGAAGGIDLALAALPPDRAQQGLVLGRDAVVALVHPDNPVAAVSAEDLAGLLEGRITDWSALGGAEAPVELILPPRDALAAGALAGLLAPGSTRTKAARLPVADIARRVAATPLALGLTLWSRRGQAARALDIAGPCGAPVAAGSFAIASGTYPLIADVAILTAGGDLPGVAGDIAAYLGSDAARARLVRAGVAADRPVLERPVGQQGDHLVRAVTVARGDEELETLQALFADLERARQLSTVYRFGSNGVRAGPDHAALTAALAGHLAGLDPERTQIFLHGHSDALETSRRRIGLSRARAEHVRALIAEAAPAFAARLRPAGFEGLAPRACDSDAAGRSLNRRVEVWVRSGQ